MYVYKAFGLVIQSDLPLPELVTAKGKPDIVIRLRHVDDSSLISNSRSYVAKTAWGTIRLHEGHEAVVEPAQQLTEPVLRMFILGPVIAELLRQRGLLLFHSSSIAINGVAIAFLGASGSGKSTLAEAFHTHGYAIVTDDVLAVQANTVRPIAFSSCPQIKLWPDAVTSLGYRVDDLTRVHTGSEKRIHRVVYDAFVQNPLPLQRMYVLTDGDHHGIEILKARSAMIELMKYPHGIALLAMAPFAKANFNQCVRLVKQVRICRLTRPRSLSTLTESVRLIEHDVAS
jgi:hypothetical protein